MMEDVTPGNAAAKTSKDKEASEVAKEPPSAGSTDVVASGSKQSPSVSTHDTADKTEGLKTTERATGSNESSVRESVHASDKSGGTVRAPNEGNGNHKPSDEEGALEPGDEAAASRPTSEKVKLSGSPDIQQSGSESISRPKDIGMETKNDGQWTAVKVSSPPKLDKPSHGSSVKEGEKSKLAQSEEKLSGGSKENKHVPKASDKSPLKRPSPPRKVSPVSQVPKPKESGLSESKKKYDADNSEKNSNQDEKRIEIGDKPKVMGSGPAEDDDPSGKSGAKAAASEPPGTNSEQKPSVSALAKDGDHNTKKFSAIADKEGPQSNADVASVDAAGKSGRSGS